MNEKTEQKPSEREVAPEPTASLAPMPEKSNLKTGNSIMAIIPQSMDETWRLANIITEADMAPDSYKRNANSVMIGIMHGMEVGLLPLAALQSIAVINKRPTIWGDGALALVHGSGLVESFDETIEGEGDAMVATCAIKRKGQSSLIVRKFSMADAKTAKLANKTDPWQQYPQRMMQMRARSWALRDGFADVLRGMHIREEVMDMTNGGALVDRGDGLLVPADAPDRPKPGDYAKPAQAPAEPEASPIFQLNDEYGQPDGDLVFNEFVEKMLSKIQELSQGDDSELLEAFWLYNNEAIEELGSARSSVERQDINAAYNEARAAIEAKISDEQAPASK